MLGEEVLCFVKGCTCSEKISRWRGCVVFSPNNELAVFWLNAWNESQTSRLGMVAMVNDRSCRRQWRGGARGGGHTSSFFWHVPQRDEVAKYFARRGRFSIPETIF